MYPGKVAPGTGKRIGGGFVQAITRFGRRLLQHEEPASLSVSRGLRVSPGYRRVEVETKKRHIGWQRPLEDRIFFMGACRTSARRQAYRISLRRVYEIPVCICAPFRFDCV